LYLMLSSIPTCASLGSTHFHPGFQPSNPRNQPALAEAPLLYPQFGSNSHENGPLLHCFTREIPRTKRVLVRNTVRSV